MPLTDSQPATLAPDPMIAPPLAPQYDDLVAGLLARVASISPKYFYDDRGSALFEQITSSVFPSNAQGIPQAEILGVSLAVPGVRVALWFGGLIILGAATLAARSMGFQLREGLADVRSGLRDNTVRPEYSAELFHADLRQSEVSAAEVHAAEAIGIDVGENDRRALCRERARGREAEAAGAARDEGGFSCDVGHSAKSFSR